MRINLLSAKEQQVIHILSPSVENIVFFIFQEELFLSVIPKHLVSKVGYKELLINAQNSFNVFEQ